MKQFFILLLLLTTAYGYSQNNYNEKYYYYKGKKEPIKVSKNHFSVYLKQNVGLNNEIKRNYQIISETSYNELNKT